MTWLSHIPLLLAMLIISCFPCWGWLRTVLPDNARYSRSLLAFAVAPLGTFALISVIGFICTPARGLGYVPKYVLAGLCALGVMGLAVQWWQRRSGGSGGHARRCRISIPIIAAMGAGVVVAILPLLIAARITDPLQQWDPSFHYNGVWTILHTSNASMTSAMGPLFDLTGKAAVYYPDAWHAFAALFATPQTVISTVNLTSILLCLWWVVGMVALADVILGPKAMPIVAIISGISLAFPADFISSYAQWPNGTSMALLPALLAFAWVIGRQWRDVLCGNAPVRQVAAGSVLFAGAAIGALCVHPISFFNAVMIAVVPAVGATGKTLYAVYREHRWPAAIFGTAALIAALGLCAYAMFNPRTAGVSRFVRSTSWIDAMYHPIVPVPPLPVRPGLIAAMICLVVMLGCGIWYAWSAYRWLCGSWLVCVIILVLAYAPDFGMKFLSGPWYSDPRRIMGAMQVVVVLLSGYGLVKIAEIVQRIGSQKQKWSMLPGVIRRVGASTVIIGCLLIASGGGALDARIAGVARVYDPQQLGPAGMASRAELEMISREGAQLPADALVVGDPSSGVVYFPVLAQRRTVFPQLTLAEKDADVRELSQTFRNIHSDPSVCQTIRRVGITHFYADTDAPYYAKMRSVRMPGFYGVDVTHGFRQIARVPDEHGGYATLYEITACSGSEGN
ncbi:DUF6541 family protein [Trueperella sp. LYQ143]|uniref:DUF6541 family protein n=1 Tax=unclassified Trueperella TaxID=2630174 RepID=UPI0039832008